MIKIESHVGILPAGAMGIRSMVGILPAEAMGVHDSIIQGANYKISHDMDMIFHKTNKLTINYINALNINKISIRL